MQCAHDWRCRTHVCPQEPSNSSCMQASSGTFLWGVLDMSTALCITAMLPAGNIVAYLCEKSQTEPPVAIGMA